METSDGTPDHLAEISRSLWQLRGMLDKLKYQLTVQDLVMDGPDQDAIRMAVDDVHQTVQAIAELEVRRNEFAVRVTEELGLPANATLQDLIDSAPSPYDEILREHRDSFLATATAIATMSRGSRERAERGVELTKHMIAIVTGETSDAGYDSSGGSVRRKATRGLVDESL